MKKGEKITIKKINGNNIYFEQGKGKQSSVNNFKWVSGPLFKPLFLKTFLICGFKFEVNIFKEIKPLKI